MFESSKLQCNNWTLVIIVINEDSKETPQLQCTALPRQRYQLNRQRSRVVSRDDYILRTISFHTYLWQEKFSRKDISYTCDSELQININLGTISSVCTHFPENPIRAKQVFLL